jgi:hypothetical protein
LLDQRVDLSRIGDVALHLNRFSSQFPDFGGHRPDGVHVPAGQHEVDPFAREPQRNGRAHAFGRAGDDRYFSVESEFHFV